MRHEPAERILQLACAMQGSRLGLSLSDIESQFRVGRRTAQRLRDAVLRVYPQTEALTDSEQRPRWRIPPTGIVTPGALAAEDIVDPKTGFGLTDHSLVTVIAKDCITANTLATAISVMGPDAGIKRVERTAGAAAHLVRKPGDEIEKRESKRLAKFLEPERDVDLEKAVQPRMDTDEHR